MTRTMSDDHKQAIATGREQARKIRAYLEALACPAPTQANADRLTRRIETIDAALPDADPMTRLKLVQERIDTEAKIDAHNAAVEASETFAQLEAEFVEVAGAYSDRAGITRAAWRGVGVPVKVLKAAGI